ncbi:MAG: hypothetical protein LUD81_07075 [Clostridiales bacterium]|nr:hypothetical protein [Clostridiales bacterium]
MKKEYLKPEIGVIKLASESIAEGGITASATAVQTKIPTLSFSSNTVTY